MIAKIGRTLLAFLGLMSIASTALAQGNTFNPYGNSGYADYREFTTPMYSNNPALPGQAVLNGQPFVSRPRANSFQDYASDLDGVDPTATAARRNASTSLPYYQAYQRLNPEFNRVYKPNDTKQDRAFFDRQKEREQKYALAISPKTDPATRARLFKELDRDSLDRPASKATASTKGANATSRTGTTSAAPSPRTSAPVERRQSAPPPLSSSSGRSSTTSRAPSPDSIRSVAPSTSARSSTKPRNRPAPDPSTIPVPPPR